MPSPSSRGRLSGKWTGTVSPRQQDQPRRVDIAIMRYPARDAARSSCTNTVHSFRASEASTTAAYTGNMSFDNLGKHCLPSGNHRKGTGVLTDQIAEDLAREMR